MANHRSSETSSEARCKTPQVQIGAPCLNCGTGCQGLLLHVWRKVCINCRCPREAHQITASPPTTAVTDGNEKDFNFYQYSWYPTGISLALVKQYMNALPPDSVPLKGTEGEKRRNTLYLKQLPLHDQDPDMCHILSDKERKRLVKFSERIKQQACGVANINVLQDGEERVQCVCCKTSIKSKSVYISIKHSRDLAWHPGCFSCTQCKDMLVDLIYFYDSIDDVVYCGRHYSDHKVPRCAGCDELIFTETFTQAEGKNWHKEHFSCEICDTPLQGKKYSSDGGVYCQVCYNEHRAQRCTHCNQPIVVGDKKVCSENGDSVFHEKCFICSKCGTSMLGKKQFIDRDILCEGCIETTPVATPTASPAATPIAQCSTCNQGITPYSRYLQLESRSWHTKCFSCIVCKKSLIEQEFQDYDGNLMCMDCFATKVNRKCHRCYRAIVGKAIQLNFKFYHPKCFTCKMCDKSLVSTKVSDKNGDLFCPACLEKVSNKCTACNKPITSQQMLYNKKPFHLACFKCAQCGSAIGNQPYYETSLKDVLCELCGDM